MVCILLGVVNTSNGGEPKNAKERNRQRTRERYAQMDKQKKDELLKRRREAYQQNKARPAVNTRESRDSPTALSQLQSRPIVPGALYNYVYHLMVPCLSSNQTT